MKRFWTALAAAALAVSLCLTAALAAGRRAPGPRYSDGSCIGFTDADGDGFCDNRISRCGGFTDADGDGLCDNRISRCGGFTDADGDGLCDNCISRCGGVWSGCGTGLGSRCGGQSRGGCRNH